jgi:hypothetical protein
MAFLKDEIDHFAARYRRIKNQDTTEARGADYEIQASRSTLERSIKWAVEAAEEQIATNSYDESTLYISTGVVYQNYSPRENLQWAYAVATLGLHFESQVGGKKADVWRTWQRKVRDVASKNRIEL